MDNDEVSKGVVGNPPSQEAGNATGQNVATTQTTTVSPSPPPAEAQPGGIAAQPVYKKKEHIATLVLAVIIVTLIVAILLYYSQLSSKHAVSTTTYTTTATGAPANTIKRISLSDIYNFMKNFNMNTSLNFYALYNVTAPSPPSPYNPPECFAPSVQKWYLAKGMRNISSPINDSMIKTSPVYEIYLNVGLYNKSSLPGFAQEFYKNGGFCEPIFNQVISNSTYSLTKMQLSGTTLYIKKFDNMNSNALNITCTPYTGPMPNVSFYAIDFIYKNVSFSDGAYGFTGHMNSTLESLISAANATLEYLKTFNYS